jgi:hypothetical protein
MATVMDIAITITADIATVVDIVTVADIATVVVVVMVDAVAAKQFAACSEKSPASAGLFYVVVYRAKRAPGESMQKNRRPVRISPIAATLRMVFAARV